MKFLRGDKEVRVCIQLVMLGVHIGCGAGHQPQLRTILVALGDYIVYRFVYRLNASIYIEGYGLGLRRITVIVLLQDKRITVQVIIFFSGLEHRPEEAEKEMRAI